MTWCGPMSTLPSPCKQPGDPLVWFNGLAARQHTDRTRSHELISSAKIVENSPLFQSKIAALALPEGFEAVVEPWPYGGLDKADENRRYFQALVFAIDKRVDNPDANFYSYPLPLIPVVDWVKGEVIRIDELATGGRDDPYVPGPRNAGIIDHCRPSEYVPELLDTSLRSDLKPLNVFQPEGTSFSVKDESLVEWQKWRMRVTFNPREGAVVHDVRYDGRSVLYRLSISDMTVPYADPRAPFHRKQAFDFGDGGVGHCANNLELGCDCLGVIKYFDGVLSRPDGSAHVSPNLICLHEQDNGIGWKHTNWRTGRAVVTRRRELVVQFILTVANYEYIFMVRNPHPSRRAHCHDMLMRPLVQIRPSRRHRCRDACHGHSLSSQHRPRQDSTMG